MNETMKSTLYLFVKEQKTEFKIGITNNIKDRYLRLKSVWGDIDLASSCMILGDRREVSGLEKTLHFLLDKWRMDHSRNLEGHSEWFSMDCFDKAIGIITSATKLRGSKSDDPIIRGIAVNPEKKHENLSRDKPNYNAPVKIDDLDKLWLFYEKGTLDFRDHPYLEDTWLWTIDIGECHIHPIDALRFQKNGSGINLASVACCYVDEPTIVQINIEKSCLSDMKKSVTFIQDYRFISGKIKKLIKNNFSKPKSFDIESTPVFENRPY